MGHGTQHSEVGSLGTSCSGGEDSVLQIQTNQQVVSKVTRKRGEGGGRKGGEGEREGGREGGRKGREGGGGEREEDLMPL